MCASCAVAAKIYELGQTIRRWLGRCATFSWSCLPAACLRRATSSSTRQGAIASALTHATAQPEPALSASTHSRRTAYRAPCIDSGGLSRAFAVLWSVGDASSGGGGSSPLALGICTLGCVLCVPSDAARASGPVGENRNASKNAIFFCAARRRCARPEKVLSMGNECDFTTFRLFPKTNRRGALSMCM